MDWLDTVIEWAGPYITKFPTWKVYKDRVGGNVYGMNEVFIDSDTSLATLKKQLGQLTPGKYILQLKAKINDSTGLMQKEFEMPYGWSSTPTTGIGALATPGQVDPTKYVSIDHAQQMMDKAISEYAAKQETIRLQEKVTTLEKEKAKWEHDKLILEKKADNKIEHYAAMIKEAKEAIPMIQGLFGKQQIAIAGTNADAIPPTQQQSAAHTETTVQDHTNPPGWDATDDRILGAISKMILMEGKGEVTPEAKAKVADMLEGVVGFRTMSPAMFSSLEPTILEHKKFYPNE